MARETETLSRPDARDPGLRTPVALLVYNRPELTLRVVDRLRKVRPRALWVAADAPKHRDPVDVAACRAVLEGISEHVDWPCRIRVRVAETHLGRGRAVAEGLDWVFSMVEEAIVLQDDCVPAESFFPFCEELLERHREDERVMMISGCNFLAEETVGEASYHFSRNFHLWAWAGWSRAWKHYDRMLKDWPVFRDGGALRRLFPNPELSQFWERRMERVYRKPRRDWELQWVFACWKWGGLAVVPAKHLVANHGAGFPGARLRSDHPHHGVATEELTFPLRPPGSVARMEEWDTLLEEEMLAEGSLAYRVQQFFRRLKEWRKAPRNSRSYQIGLRLRLLAMGSAWRDALWLVKPDVRHLLGRLGLDFNWTSAAHTVFFEFQDKTLRVECRDDWCDVQSIVRVFGEENYAWLAELEPLHRVMDLGAQIGAFALYLRFWHPDADVLCVEPDPRNAKMLRTNLPEQRVTILEAVVTGDGTPDRVPLEFAVRRTDETAGTEKVRLDVAGRTFSSILSSVYEAEVDLVRVEIADGAPNILTATPPHLLCRVRHFLVEYHSTEVRGELRRLFRWDFEVRHEFLLGRNHGLVHYERSARTRRA